MNDKAISAMKRMLEDPSLLKEILRSGNEYYFKYKDHTFSITHRSNDSDWGPYSFYVYPAWKEDTSTLASLLERGFSDDYPVKAYHSANYDIIDDKEVFRKLYELCDGRYLNIDDIFDDILRR